MKISITYKIFMGRGSRLNYSSVESNNVKRFRINNIKIK